MRHCFFAVTALVLLLVAASVDAGNIAYGHPRELKNVESVYVWQTDPAGLKDEIIAILKSAVPDLKIADQEGDAGAVLIVRRRASEAAGETSWVTSAMVVRQVDAKRARILMEPVSVEADQKAALLAVTEPFIHELQRANGTKFGSAPPGRYEDTPGPRFRSTAGLRTGMTKDQVREAVGTPTRVDGKGGRTQVWWYETTDGVTRVVFGGDAVVTTQFTTKE